MAEKKGINVEEIKDHIRAIYQEIHFLVSI